MYKRQLDDRPERAGVKFNDADLCGWPLQIIIGKRGLAAGVAELKLRATGQKVEIPLDELVERVSAAAQYVDCCPQENAGATGTDATGATPGSDTSGAGTSGAGTSSALCAQPYPNPYAALFTN